MAAARTDQAPGRVGRHPAIVLAVMPLPVLRAEDPLPPLHVPNRQGPNPLAEVGSVEHAGLPRGDQLEITDLGQGEGFDSHRALG